MDHDPPRAVVQVDVQQLEAEREKFHAALDTLDDALVRLEQLWIFNVRDPMNRCEDDTNLSSRRIVERFKTTLPRSSVRSMDKFLHFFPN